jgi:hypothetical protein
MKRTHHTEWSFGANDTKIAFHKVAFWGVKSGFLGLKSGFLTLSDGFLFFKRLASKATKTLVFARKV